MTKIWMPFLVACLLFCGCSGNSKPGAEAEPVTPVQVAKVTRASVQRVVTADAILYPVDQANVTTKISAPVNRFLVKRGDRVRRGQLLAVLENRDFAASVQENKSMYAQAESAYRNTTAAAMPDELTRARADLESARQGLEAARKLYENRQTLQREGALAQKLVDDAKVAMVQAESQFATVQRHLESLQQVGRQEQVKGAQAQVDSAKARYQNAEAQLSYTEIRSPIDGVVADRPLFPGEMAASGSAIISIINVSQVIARANVPVKDAASIRAGQRAAIAAPGGEVTGRVTVVSPAVDPNSTTVEVWVQAANPGGVLKPGTTAHVSIVTETIPNALVVPASALLSLEEGGEKVMAVGPDSKAQERKVEVGVRESDKVQIVQGLKDGETVITSGGLGLEDKAKVKVESASAAEKPAKDDDEKAEKK